MDSLALDRPAFSTGKHEKMAICEQQELKSAPQIVTKEFSKQGEVAVKLHKSTNAMLRWLEERLTGLKAGEAHVIYPCLATNTFVRIDKFNSMADAEIGKLWLQANVGSVNILQFSPSWFETRTVIPNA